MELGLVVTVGDYLSDAARRFSARSSGLVRIETRQNALVIVRLK